MNERLIKLIEYLGYSPSAFADEIGVIRSSISHIINGRNKPGVDLLQRVLKRFPQVSTDWLLMGTGPMLKNLDMPNNTQSNTGEAERTARQMSLPEFTNVKNLSRAEAMTPTQEKNGFEEASQSEAAVTGAGSPGTDKTVSRIIIYFSDNTFQEFIPPKA